MRNRYYNKHLQLTAAVAAASLRPAEIRSQLQAKDVLNSY